MELKDSPKRTKPMTNIKRISTPYSYSAAVIAGDQVFLALHRGFGDHFSEQFKSTMESIMQTLAQVDVSLDHLVKVNVWLKNIQDLPEMEKGFHQYFAEDRFPARMTATTEFIDTDCLLMIDGIAIKDTLSS
jgi:2-iminobutanoate/2-iminopropanoate deaminase